MRLRFLGTGTSFGVPVVGCDCTTCTSKDPRDRRTRHAAIIESDDGHRLLIDTPPELRLQLIAAGVPTLDAVWFTHCHADHVQGIDDLRAVSVRRSDPLRIFAGPDCAETLRHRFEYIFDNAFRPPPGTSRPELHLETIDPAHEVRAAGMKLRPACAQHGPMTVYGLRTGGLGYMTDAKTLMPGAFDAFAGCRVLVLNALWFGNPHPTHLNVEEAVELSRQIGAERTFLTHLTHRVRHQELLDALPPGIEPAYDGLTVDI